MRKLLKSKVTNKGILAWVTILNRSRKVLTVLGVIAMIWGYVPWKQIQAEFADEPVIEYVEQTPEQNQDVSLPDYPTTTDPDFDPSLVEIESEVTDERTETTKTFRKIDGTYELAMYNDVIHYFENGEYKQVDNSLVDIGNEYENLANKFKLKFPKKLDDNKQIKLSMDNYSIDWNVLNITSSDIEYDDTEITPNNIKELVNINQSILYRNIQPNVDIEYIITGSKVKENIILNQYISDFSMTFEYKLNDLEITEDEDGNIVFINDNNEVIFVFSDLFMTDNELNDSFDVEFSYIKTGNKTYEITITPSDDWLQSAVYPVYIDPSITDANVTMSIYDTYVFEDNPSTNYSTSDTIKIHKSTSGLYDAYGLIKFDIPSELDDKILTYSYLTFTRESSLVGNQVNIYANTDYFISTTVAYNNRPSFDTQIIDYTVSTLNSERIFDITKTVKEWVEGVDTSSKGFTLFQDEYSIMADDYHSMENGTSSYKPTVLFGYIDKEGIKDYWTYTKQDLGDAGTGLVSDFTGDLFFTRTDLSFETEKQAISSGFIYSINNPSIGYGKGWNSVYNIELNYDDIIETYFTIDPSGNKVYYYEGSSSNCDNRVLQNTYENETCFIAEDGSKNLLVISKSDYTQAILEYRLLTSGNTRIVFTKYGSGDIDSSDNTYGLPNKYVDISNNLEIIIYRLSTAVLIDYIIDDSGNKIDFSYTSNELNYIDLKIAYNTSGSVTTIERADFTINASDLLTQIDYSRTYESGSSLESVGTIMYSYYTGDLLQTVTNSINNTVTYDYDTSGRVDSIAYKQNTSDLELVSISYAGRMTEYTNKDGNSLVYSFDNYGHTINIYDEFGNSQSMRRMNPYSMTTSQPMYYFNHAQVMSTSTEKAASNHIRNHGFDYLDTTSDIDWGLIVDDYNGLPSYTIEDEYSTNEFVFGSNSLRLTVASGQEAHYEQKVYLDPGTYTVSGYIKNGTANDYAYLRVSGHSSGGTYSNTDNTDEWIRKSVTFTVATDNQEVKIQLHNLTGGTVYYDNIQLVEGFTDTRMNMVSNNSFEQTYIQSTTEKLFAWTLNSRASIEDYTSTFGIYDTVVGNKGLKIIGDADNQGYAYQELEGMTTPFNSPRSYVVGGWANAIVAPTQKASDELASRYLRIRVDFLNDDSCAPDDNDYDDCVEFSKYVDFDSLIEGWQFAQQEVLISATDLESLSTGENIESAYLFVEFSGEGEVTFDYIQVEEGLSFTKYSYTDYGLIKRVDNPSGGYTLYIYDNEDEDVNDANDPKRLSEIRTYDKDNYLTSDPIIIDDDDPITIDFVEVSNVRTTVTTNSEGQTTRTKVGGDTQFFDTTTVFLLAGNKQYIESTDDEFDNRTSYDYDLYTGLLETITNANSINTDFTYNNDGTLNTVENNDYCIGTTCSKVTYQYDSNNRLVEIEFNANFSYHITYDSENRVEQIKVNSTAIMTYGYNDDTSYISNQILTKTYANGDSITFEYDSEDRIEYVKYSSDGTNFHNRYQYEYDQKGRVAVFYTYHDEDDDGDTEVVSAEFYTYSISDKLIAVTTDTGNVILYDYDSEGNLTDLYFNINGYEQDIDYAFNKFLDFTSGDYNSIFYDQTNYSTEAGNNISKEYNYKDEALFRLDFITLTDGVYDTFEQSFTYSGNTTRINTIEYDIDNGSSSNIILKYSYTYDSLNNIESETYYEDTVLKWIRSYGYDELNQLHQENIFDKSQDTDGDGNDDCSTLSSTCFSKYFYYDTRGNIDYTKTFLYGAADKVSPTIPSFFHRDRGSITANMRYGDEQTYTDIYELDLNESPGSFNIYYMDSTLQNLLSGVSETKTFDNLDITTEGYYYQSYTATSFNGVELYFKIVFKVGDPTSVDVQPLEQMDYVYSSTWQDQLIGIRPVTYSGGNPVYGAYEQEFIYDDQGNPITIYDFEYEGDTYTNAELEWEGRKLKEVIIGDTSGKNLLDPNNIGYGSSWFMTDDDIRLKANTTYTMSFPDIMHDDHDPNDPWLLLEGQGFMVDEESFTLDNGKWEITFTTGSYAGAACFEVSANNTSQYISYYGFEVQLEEGTNPTTFEDYFVPDTISVEYRYNDQGYRTHKIIDDQVITYTLSGDKVLYETDGTYAIIYAYDYDGKLIGFSLNTDIDSNSFVDYFYVRNQFNDITRIVDKTGAIIVEYEYDAWGNILSIEDSSSNDIVSTYNPYTYRGYRYDKEISMYYLNSRFYNPYIGRFISSDGLLGEQGDILGHNMYVYTKNNPVMYSDASGYISEKNKNLAINTISVILALAVLYIVCSSGVGASCISGVTGFLGQIVSNLYNQDGGAFQGVLGATIGGVLFGGLGGNPVLSVLCSSAVNAGINEIENEIYGDSDPEFFSIDAFAYDFTGYVVSNTVTLIVFPTRIFDFGGLEDRFCAVMVWWFIDGIAYSHFDAEKDDFLERFE